MRIPVALLALLLLAACQESGPTKDDPSYAGDVQPLFNSSCVGCHGGGSPAADYDLASRAGALGAGTDTIANVIAGNPGASELHRRLDEGTMPPTGRWDSSKVATVRNWIARGAKDN
ncbi:MAG: c-type cytochrome domain-containing protein [bacterium]